MKKTVISSNYSENISEVIHEELTKVLQTVTEKMSAEYKRDIEVLFTLNVK